MSGVIRIASREVRLSAKSFLAKGGEAEVHLLNDDVVVKIWKGPHHPDFRGLSEQARAAESRLQLQREKVARLQSRCDLPQRLVTPTDVARSCKDDSIIGFTMRRVPAAIELARFGEKSTRSRARDLLVELGELLKATHHRGVIVGDFNDHNVLVASGKPWLIDVDSYQLEGLPCVVYSEAFLDPLLSDTTSAVLSLNRSYNKASDHYAYAIMVMKTLLFVGPYGGVYKKKSRTGCTLQRQRPLQRITVFHPDVRYPKPAAPLETLPDSLLHHLYETFVDDRRVPLPKNLLRQLRFTTCSTCGLEHARSRCPRCTKVLPFSLNPSKHRRDLGVSRRSAVSVTVLLETKGEILDTSTSDGTVRWLVHEGEEYRREDGSIIMRGPRLPHHHHKVIGARTLFSREGELVLFDRDGRRARREAVDWHDHQPTVAHTGDVFFWVDGGHLWREEQYGPANLGEVVPRQTRIWAGPSFGFGFFRVGGYSSSFLFSTVPRGFRGLIDGSEISIPTGRIIDTFCTISHHLCWLFISYQGSNRTHSRLQVFDREGAMHASSDKPRGDKEWLDSVAGSTAVGSSLFVATDRGIQRVEIDQNSINVTDKFRSSEPFVQNSSKLFPDKNGLIVVNQYSIIRLCVGKSFSES